MVGKFVTVVETAEYLKKAAKLLSAAERDELVDRLAVDPRCGEIIPQSGGVRKVRIALEGRGKRGGARVIYYYHSEAAPLFILTVYAKAERDDLSAADLKRYRAMVTLIKSALG
jgi:hypothetical protein